MKFINFRGDLTDMSSKQKPLMSRTCADGVAQITAGRKFHDDAEEGVVEEGLVVANDVFVLAGSEQADLIHGVFTFNPLHASYIHLLESIHLIVF